MANVFKNNELRDLIEVRAAEVAGYLTVGADSKFGDQLVGKRNGQTYRFVRKDNGKYVRGKNITGQSSVLTETEIPMTVQVGNVMIDTDFVEAVTDVNWDKEIAQPNAKALIEGLTQDVINEDIGRANTAFVGAGWGPLIKANSFLRSISSETRYGFLDPMVESILPNAGEAFKPLTMPSLDARGEVKSMGGTDYRMQQFLPSFEISEDLSNELASATVKSYTPSSVTTVDSDGVSRTEEFDILELNNVTEDIPVGTPLFIEDVVAANLIGNKTSSPKAFIAYEQISAGKVKVRKNDFAGQGTKDAIFKDGTNVTAAGLVGKKLVNAIKPGAYYTGLIRLDGVMEFDTLKKQDWSNADLTTSGIEGITVHCGRAVNVEAGTNKTRWCVACLAGIVEQRGVAYVCIKDEIPNAVVVM